MENGAFSDDGVAQASKNFINVALDADKQINRPISIKLGARSLPTVVWLRPNEEVIKSITGLTPELRDPTSTRDLLDKIYKEHAKEAAFVTWVGSVDEAKEVASDRLIFLFFHDKKKGSRMMQRNTLDNLKFLQALGKYFVGVKIAFDRKSDLAKSLKVSYAPTMVVLDPEGEVVTMARGPKKPKEAIRFLEKALKTHRRAMKKKAY